MIKEKISLIKKFLNFLEISGSSKNTISSYQKDLNQFLDYCFLKINFQAENFSESNFFSSLKQEDFDSYLQKLYEEKIQTSSLARKISCLRSFFKFIFYEIRAIDKLPEIRFELPKAVRKIPKTLSKNEINSLISFCKKESQNPEKKNFLTWALMVALLEFLYSSGCRISESLSLKIGQIIDFSGQIHDEILIQGKGGVERLIFVNQSAQNSIENFLRMRFYEKLTSANNFQNIKSFSSEFLFSLPGKKDAVSRQRVFQLLKEAAAEIGINPVKLSPHVIRHSIAIHLLNGRGEEEDNDHEEITADIRLIQEFLGHKSINTTQIYLEYQNFHDLKKVVEQKHPLCRKDFLENKEKNS